MLHAFVQHGEQSVSPLILHTSDLHLGDALERDSASNLDLLASAVSQMEPDVVVVAGDVFENNRVAPSLARRVMARLDSLAAPIVLLPGNHDCLGPDSVYEQVDTAALRNVTVFGMGNAGSAVFGEHDLEVCGSPHRGYADQAPIGMSAAPRTTRWRVTVAHGHWERGPADRHRGWLFTLDDVARLDTDYLALGHWDIPTQVSGPPTPAYYSGSPSLCGSVNLVRLEPGTPATVTIAPVRPT